MNRKYSEGMQLSHDGKRISMPTHILFYVSAMYGLAFILPEEVFDMSYSPLYSFASYYVVWAWCASLITVCTLAIIMLLTKNKFLAHFVGVAGFGVWLWAGIGCIFVGYWFGFVVIALPNAIFWIWFSIKISQVRDEMRTGTIKSWLTKRT